MADNASPFVRQARGAPRQGTALLAGRVVCGHCGYQLRVAYKPQRRYSCTALAASYGAATCRHVDGATLDTAVVEAFFAAPAPAELDGFAEVMAQQQADPARLAQHYADEVERTRLAAHLAQRHDQAVDPDNRLVAATLERHWEAALRDLTVAQQAAEHCAAQPRPSPLSPALMDQLRDLSHTLPARWHAAQLTPPQPKELLRTLIQQGIVTRPTPDTLLAKVGWVSGAVTPLTLPPPILRQAAMAHYDQFVQAP